MVRELKCLSAQCKYGCSSIYHYPELTEMLLLIGYHFLNILYDLFIFFNKKIITLFYRNFLHKVIQSYLRLCDISQLDQNLT